MDLKKAYEEFMIIDFNGEGTIDRETANTALEVIIKAIPEKVENAQCPRCKNKLRCEVKPQVLLSGRRKGRRADEYCNRCGQHLDWSD